MRKWRNIALGGAAATMLLATACGAQEKPADTTVVQPAAGSSSAPAASPTDPASAGAKEDNGLKSAGALDVRSDAKLGAVLTDSKGWTLYRFDKDTAAPAKSNCNDACEKAWPPVAADDATATANINKDLLGSVTRADGTK